jgi:hypothetical protein
MRASIKLAAMQRKATQSSTLRRKVSAGIKSYESNDKTGADASATFAARCSAMRAKPRVQLCSMLLLIELVMLGAFFLAQGASNDAIQTTYSDSAEVTTCS